MRLPASTLLGFLRPFGDGDGGDGKSGNGNDSANKGGSQGQGDKGQNSGAGRETPVTMEAIRGLLDERLTPLEREVKTFGNFRGQVSRHLKIGGGRSDDGDDANDDDKSSSGSKSGKGKSDAEKMEGAAARRLQDLEERANRAQIKADLGEALAAHTAGLVVGAREKIERLVRSGLRVVEGRTVYDTGEELLDLAEVVKKEAADPIFRPASSKGSGGGTRGEADAGAQDKGSTFEDVNIESMSDEEFEKFRKKHKPGR